MVVGTVGATTLTEHSVAYGHITDRGREVEQVSHTESLASTDKQPQTTVVVAHNPQVVEAKVREYFSDIPIMAEIARCESTYRHRLSDGSVLRGYVDQADTGVMQINLRYHAQTAERLGLDLENIYDNMAYARYLYEREGTRPWNASAPCWGQHHLAANY